MLLVVGAGLIGGNDGLGQRDSVLGVLAGGDSRHSDTLAAEERLDAPPFLVRGFAEMLWLETVAEGGVDDPPDGQREQIRDLSFLGALAPLVNDAQFLAGYRWPIEEAYAVMMCESGGNPGEISPDGRNIGLMQINLIHGYGVEYLLQPANNVAVAYTLWLDQGWIPWACTP